MDFFVPSLNYYLPVDPILVTDHHAWSRIDQLQATRDGLSFGFAIGVTLWEDDDEMREEKSGYIVSKPFR